MSKRGSRVASDAGLSRKMNNPFGKSQRNRPECPEWKLPEERPCKPALKEKILSSERIDLDGGKTTILVRRTALKT
jgi:hypothetical protein